jgi:1-phosphatidylinositol-4-phosphate 5-kinase
LKAKESAGKSGSFFFFSYDNQFLLKTMNDNEMSIFNESLPDYYFHLRQNKNSLMARIYGIFTVMMEELKPVHILLMQNSARTQSAPLYIFDLKGSMVNRECKGEGVNEPGGGTLKDVNLLTVCKDKHWLLL